VADLEVRPSRLCDADWLALRLRSRDRDEAVAAAGPDVEATLYAAITASGALCWTATENGKPVFVIGCAPVEGIPGLGSPWLMAAQSVDRYPGALTRITKRHIAVMLQTYQALLNYVDARNSDSVRWLARLGFRVDEPETYGVEGRPFHPFMMGNI